MPNNTLSAPAVPTNTMTNDQMPDEQKGPTVLDRLIALMDLVFPSVVIPPAPDGIGEPSQWYDGRMKPDFVRADDEGWSVT